MSSPNCADVPLLLKVAPLWRAVAGASIVLGSTAVASAAVTSLQLENDLFGGTDRYYTHGTRLEYTYDPEHAPTTLERIGTWFSCGKTPENVSVHLGQLLYTPSNIRIVQLRRNERPYGAWLFLGTNGGTELKDESWLSYSLSLGIVGPAAGGRITQTAVHRWRNIQEPLGWSSQLPNEPAVNIAMDRTWRLLDAPKEGLGVALYSSAGMNLGNLFIFGRTALTARVGLNLPRELRASSINPTIRPSVAMFTSADHPLPRWSAYLFGTVEGRAVAHNSFVEGSLFRSSHGTDPRTFVADFIVGGALRRFESWEFSYAFVVRSHEFSGQHGAQKFGSISLSIAH